MERFLPARLSRSHSNQVLIVVVRSYGQVLRTIAHRDFRRPSGALACFKGPAEDLDPAEFGSPDGEVPVEGAHNAVCEACLSS